jgi:hypothetical protein
MLGVDLAIHWEQNKSRLKRFAGTHPNAYLRLPLSAGYYKIGGCFN